MVKRLMLAVLLATGGAGLYVYSSGSLSTKSENTDPDHATTSDDSAGEWQVEYVDGEGNPIPRDTGIRGASGRFKLTSNPLLKRLPGVSTASKRTNAADCDQEGFKKSSGG